MVRVVVGRRLAAGAGAVLVFGGLAGLLVAAVWPAPPVGLSWGWLAPFLLGAQVLRLYPPPR